LIDFLAFVVFVLRQDFRLDVVLTLEHEKPVREECVGTEETVLVIETVDLERLELDVEVDLLVLVEMERVDDTARVLDGAGADVLSLNSEAFSCRYDWR
jgi:hypothetical protein